MESGAGRRESDSHVPRGWARPALCRALFAQLDQRPQYTQIAVPRTQRHTLQPRAYRGCARNLALRVSQLKDLAECGDIEAHATRRLTGMEPVSPKKSGNDKVRPTRDRRAEEHDSARAG